jgi:hypothetical protein
MDGGERRKERRGGRGEEGWRRGEALRRKKRLNATSTNGFPGRLIPPDPPQDHHVIASDPVPFSVISLLASIFLPLDLLIF